MKILLIGVSLIALASSQTIWPWPQQLKDLGRRSTIDPSQFKIIQDPKKHCPVLDDAIQRYQKLFFLKDCSMVGPAEGSRDNYETISVENQVYLKELSINITNDCEAWPKDNMVENYTLYIDTLTNPGQAKLVSPSVWGALRGLETFSQMISYDGQTFWINSTTVDDYPRFSFRGIMLDSARHFQPLSVIYKNLDAMAYDKMNVFHWHIVDDQSFPFVSTTNPDLSKKGAYYQTHTYKPADVSAVLDYARLRGIRVIVEFDSPGHTLSWGKGMPGILTPCYKGGQPDGTYGPMDPSSQILYPFLSYLFSEIADRFPDQYLFLGGDEVSFDCWKSNPNIAQFMMNLNISGDYAALESYYMQKLINIVDSLNKSYIIWQEVFDNGVQLHPETVVNVWKTNPTSWQDELARVTNNGYRALLSAPWYLNLIRYGVDWDRYYTIDPQDFTGNAKQKSLVQGGEATMWAEYVDRSTTLARLWPRASAVSERLWSSADVTDVNSARIRLDVHRCLLQQRGISVEPVTGPGACPCDYVD